MAIKNKLCLSCTHSGICKIEDKIMVFDGEAKKDLGVDITIDKCKEFKEVE